MYDRIVSSAIHEAKYNRRDPFDAPPRWPEARRSINDDAENIPITEKDLEVILEAIVEKIFDEIGSIIDGLRIR